MYLSRSNLSMMTAFKGEFHVILQRSPAKQSEGSYPKMPLIVKRPLVDDFRYRHIDFTCPELGDTNHSLSQRDPNSSQLSQTYRAKHFRT